MASASVAGSASETVAPWVLEPEMAKALVSAVALDQAEASRWARALGPVLGHKTELTSARATCSRNQLLSLKAFAR